jgi:hypothetical protein
MVVALIALFLSLGGVSYGVATGFIDSREIKNNTVSTKDVRNNGLRGADVRNNTLTGSDVNEARLGKVPTAGTADTATNATNATNATTAGNANTLDGKDSTEFGPVAYARVNGGAATGGDTVDDALSRGITDANVVHPQAGVYCFIGLGFTPKNLVATIDVNDSPGGGANIDTIYTHVSGFGTCTGVVNQTQAAVRTRNAGLAADRSFFVVFE